MHCSFLPRVRSDHLKFVKIVLENMMSINKAVCVEQECHPEVALCEANPHIPCDISKEGHCM